jgi:peptide methionine sulfoxide reductase MsrA
VSGYIGIVENPTYAAICKGDTGHEAIRITFDSSIIFWNTLELFFANDPTTLNRQEMMWERNTALKFFYHSPLKGFISGLYRVLTQEKILKSQ